MDEGRFRSDDFELYNVARQFRKGIYRLIRQLPKEERFSLDPQMRRAALSVTNSIAEGHGRWHYLENLRFCRISRGSIDEILDDLNTCVDEGYGDANLVTELRQQAYSLIGRLNSYMNYLRRCKQRECPASVESGVFRCGR
jgi:four helix bundle protein